MTSKDASFLIIAHRGDSEHFPENTLPAFEAAVQAGADMIEFDIALAADGVFVVIHDDTLRRTTRRDGFVGHLPGREISQLDAGRWFEQKRRKFRAIGLESPPARPTRTSAGEAIRVPTLDEVLDLLGPKLPLNIEIKPFFPLSLAGRMQAALSRLVTQLHERKLAGQVLLSSTNFYLLEYCRELSRDVRLGIVYRRPLTDFDPIRVARAFGASSLHPYHRQVNERVVAALHKAGLKVFPYTVNKPERLRELRDLGCDGVFTDDPAAARSAVAPAAPAAAPAPPPAAAPPATPSPPVPHR